MDAFHGSRVIRAIAVREKLFLAIRARSFQEEPNAYSAKSPPRQRGILRDDAPQRGKGRRSLSCFFARSALILLGTFVNAFRCSQYSSLVGGDMTTRRSIRHLSRRVTFRMNLYRYTGELLSARHQRRRIILSIPIVPSVINP